MRGSRENNYLRARTKTGETTPGIPSSYRAGIRTALDHDMMGRNNRANHRWATKKQGNKRKKAIKGRKKQNAKLGRGPRKAAHIPTTIQAATTVAVTKGPSIHHLSISLSALFKSLKAHTHMSQETMQAGQCASRHSLRLAVVPSETWYAAWTRECEMMRRRARAVTLPEKFATNTARRGQNDGNEISHRSDPCNVLGIASEDATKYLPARVHFYTAP
ncbi:hypothetical protein MRX96_042979 [Rhipicephalus microplus]